MNILVYSILIICLLFIAGYLLFKAIRKKADKSFSESQSDIRYIETLKSDTTSLLGELAELLMPKFEAHAKVLQAKQQELDNVPFNTIAKNTDTKESFESILSSLQDMKSFISDIGLEYVSDDNIKPLIETVKNHKHK